MFITHVDERPKQWRQLVQKMAAARRLDKLVQANETKKFFFVWANSEGGAMEEK